MLDKLLTYIKEGSVYAGLEICERNGTDFYNLLVLHRKNDILHIAKELESTKHGEILGHIQKKTPLFLIVNTSKVLTKKIDTFDSNDPNELVNQAFPSLDPDNFYYEIIQSSTNPVVSISRKDYIDTVIGKLKTHNIDPAHVSLGVSSFENIVRYFGESRVAVSNFELGIDDGHIDTIHPLSEKIPEQYDLNGLTLNGQSLLAFSGIVGYLGKQNTTSNLAHRNAISRKEFENGRIFNFGLKASLAFFLFVLLLNFFAFDYYFGCMETLKASMELNDSKRDQLEKLEASVSRKRERVDRLNSSGNSIATYFLDRLAKDIPPTILLDNITYQPLAKPLRETKPIELEQNKILVSGISKDGDLFSKWIAALEKLDWIRSVETMDYDYVNGSVSNFSIKIRAYEKRG